MQDATIRNKTSAHIRRKFWTLATQIHQQSQTKITTLETFT